MPRGYHTLVQRALQQLQRELSELVNLAQPSACDFGGAGAQPGANGDIVNPNFITGDFTSEKIRVRQGTGFYGVA